MEALHEEPPFYRAQEKNPAGVARAGPRAEPKSVLALRKGRLLVVLFLVDLLALLVLGFGELLALLGGDLAVGRGLLLHGLHFLLALLELGGFLRGELARLHALLDAVLLVGLALVDDRRLGLRGHGQGGGDQGGKKHGLHRCSPWGIGNVPAHALYNGTPRGALTLSGGAIPGYDSAPFKPPFRMSATLFHAMLLSVALPLTTQAVLAEAVSPPAAPRKPVVLEKFGDRRVDDFHWLREKSNPEVIHYLDAENRYTEALMQPLEGFRESLYKEMLARIKETDESVPYRVHGYWYYQREVQGLQYPIYCRRKGSMEAAEEVMLDVNELAKGHAYTSVGLIDVSPDSSKLAYTVDFTGFRQYTLHVKDLATGELMRDTAARVTSTAWASDSRTLFYVEEHETTKRSYRLHRHSLDQPGDVLVYDEADELYDIGVGNTRSDQYIVLGITSKDTSEMRVLRADDPAGELTVIEPRRAGHEYYLDHHGDEFYIRTNDKGRNFRLVRAPVADPASANWKQVVAHRPLVMLE